MKTRAVSHRVFMVTSCLIAALAFGASPVVGQDPLLEAGIDALNGEACEAGDCSAAHSFFVQAADRLEAGDPNRANVLGYVVRAALAGGSDEIVEHLWEYFKEGRTVAAVNYAFEALTDERDRYESESVDLLTVVAMGLSVMTYDPVSFPGPSWDADVRALRGRPEIGRGISELLAWHDNAEVWGPPAPNDELNGCSDEMLRDVRTGQHRAWRWWNTPSSQPSKIDVSRTQAGRGLIAQLGAWYLSQAELGRAERFLCVAALLDEDDVMDYAFRDLAWTYVDAGIEQPMRWLEGQYQDQFHSVDQDYLKPIEDAYNFHPWYRKRRYVAPPTILLIGGAVCWFVFDSCGRGGADGQVVITIP